MWKYILTWTVTLMFSSVTESGRKTSYYYLQNKVEYLNKEKAYEHHSELKRHKGGSEFVLKSNLQNWSAAGSAMELEYISEIKIDSIYVN